MYVVSGCFLECTSGNHGVAEPFVDGSASGFHPRSCDSEHAFLSEEIPNDLVTDSRALCIRNRISRQWPTEAGRIQVERTHVPTFDFTLGGRVDCSGRSGQDGDDPGRATAATFDLHRQGNDRGARGGDFFEAGHVFQAEDTGSV